MASYVIEGPAVLYCGAANCKANAYATIDSTTDTLVGITETGVTISSSLMTHRLSTDVYGGTEGPPADLLILGAQASIRGTLVKWGADALTKLISNLRTQSPGVIPWPGHGVWGGNEGFCFWVVGHKKSYYFPRCELATQPREWNISALERKLSLNITAYSTYSNTTTNFKPHIYWTNTVDPFIGKVGPSCGET